MSLLKTRFASRKRMPYTANSAEKNREWRGLAPTKARCVNEAERPESMEAAATKMTPRL